MQTVTRKRVDIIISWVPKGLNADRGPDNGNPDLSPCARYRFLEAAFVAHGGKSYDNNAPCTVSYITMPIIRIDGSGSFVCSTVLRLLYFFCRTSAPLFVLPYFDGGHDDRPVAAA